MKIGNATVSPSDAGLIVAALRVAAEVYAKDAATMSQIAQPEVRDRMHKQFRSQADIALRLADLIEAE